MGTRSYINLRSTGCRLVLVLCLGLLQAQVQAAPSSDLSRWLSDTLAAQLTELLAHHPRYRGRSVALISQGHNALEDAVAVVLRSQLAAQGSIILVSREPGTAPPIAGSVDDLSCLQAGPGDLALRVDVREDRSRGDRVSVTLVEATIDGGGAPRLWQWAGTLTRTERGRARQASGIAVADGSLDSPWTEADVEAAATSLSRDLACRLRPTIATRIRLQWDESEPLPPLFRDTVNTSRHILGSYRELAMTEDKGDYLVVAELRPFRGDIFQLWLTGRPQAPLREPVQAATYFRVAGLAWPPAPATSRPLPPAGAPIEYLHVEMLGARQADRRGSGADLRVALRLVNRAQWPIAYGLRLSAGHFMHCIARPTYYRHDRYGTLAGTLAPGGSEVRDLVVENLQHAPLPWFGPARCAGSADLESFERYATHGYRVTEYVRWDM